MHTRGREDTLVARGVAMDEGTWELLGWSACPVGFPGQGCLSLLGCLVVFVFMFILQCERWQTPELKMCLPSWGLRMECGCRGGEGKPGGAWPRPSHRCAWFSERHWGRGGAIKRPRLVTEEGGARGEPKETQGKWVCPSPHHSLPKLRWQWWGPVLRGREFWPTGELSPCPLSPLQHDPGVPPQPTAGPLSKRKQETRSTPSDLPLRLGQGVRSSSLAQNPGARWLGEGGTHSPAWGDSRHPHPLEAALRAQLDSEHPPVLLRIPLPYFILTLRGQYHRAGKWALASGITLNGSEATRVSPLRTSLCSLHHTQSLWSSPERWGHAWTQGLIYGLNEVFSTWLRVWHLLDTLCSLILEVGRIHKQLF